MELKVWVDGLVKVVCGLSPNTSCQDVVITLAQAIGQTGRYILIMKLRENEKHLLPDDCPLQHLSKLGQLAAEVMLILRRTGPSLSEGPHKTSTHIHPGFLRSSEPELNTHKGPQKAFTFNLGYSTIPKRTKPNRSWSPSPSASPLSFPNLSNALDSLPPGPIKEEMFKQILQQQSLLRELESQIEDLERETDFLERKRLSIAILDPTSDVGEELKEVELRQKQNEIKLMEETWEEELQAEIKREEDMCRRLQQIHSSIDGQTQEIGALRSRSADLEQELKVQSQSPPEDNQQRDEALRRLTVELHKRLQTGEVLEKAFAEAQWELQTAKERVKGRLEQIENLNKELRQCNLQQFIQQTGAILPTELSRSINESLLSTAGLVE